MLLTLTFCACAHSPGRAPTGRETVRATASSKAATGTSPSEAERASEGATQHRGLVAASLFEALMGYDPRLSTTHEAVTRVSYFEALELANALSARDGLAACYEVSCAGALAPGCARMGQPYCEDLRQCTTRRRPEPCGYRLPVSGGGDDEVAVWLEEEGGGCAVGGRTRLSSPDADPMRRASARCALRADHVGVALSLGSPPPSPGPDGAETSRP